MNYNEDRLKSADGVIPLYEITKVLDELDLAKTGSVAPGEYASEGREIAKYMREHKEGITTDFLISLIMKQFDLPRKPFVKTKYKEAADTLSKIYEHFIQDPYFK